MKPQTGPSSKPAISIDLVREAVSDFPDETQICALVSPVGIQIQLFYDDFTLEKVLYGYGVEFADITHIIYQSEYIPHNAMSSFLQDNCKHGVFDVCGVLYITEESLIKINKFRALNGHPTFRYIESALMHILNNHEFAEELRFTPNWSDSITHLSCIHTYVEVLEVLSANNKLFHVMDHFVCTVGTIDNIQKYKQDLLTNENQRLTHTKKTLVLFKNDISHLYNRFVISAESNIIGEVIIDDTPTKIKIEAIEAEPNRYGRIRPVISSNEITKHELEFHLLELNTMEDLAKSKYKVGDVIEVSFINGRPVLGNIVDRTKSQATSPLVNENCCSCGKKLIYKSGHLYCQEPICESSVLDKILYAKSKRVLDLPLSWHDIHDLVVMRRDVVDIPSLFNLDRSSLNCIFDTDMVDFVLKTLQTRINQLNGHGYDKHIQNLAQGRFLDALSIVGLHSQNIKRLKKSLMDSEWCWPDLPYVLTSKSMLRGFGIQRPEVDEIVASAAIKMHELETLIREF